MSGNLLIRATCSIRFQRLSKGSRNKEVNGRHSLFSAFPIFAISLRHFPLEHLPSFLPSFFPAETILQISHLCARTSSRISFPLPSSRDRRLCKRSKQICKHPLTIECKERNSTAIRLRKDVWPTRNVSAGSWEKRARQPGKLQGFTASLDLIR